MTHLEAKIDATVDFIAREYKRVGYVQQRDPTEAEIIALREDVARRLGEQCDNCGSQNIGKIKGCIRCFTCGYKADCNGW